MKRGLSLSLCFFVINRYYRRIVRWLRLRGVGRLYPLNVHTWLNLYDISRLNPLSTCYWSMHQVCVWYKCTCIHWYTVPIQSYTESTLKIWQYSQKIARLTWYCIWIMCPVQSRRIFPLYLWGSLWIFKICLSLDE